MRRAHAKFSDAQLTLLPRETSAFDFVAARRAFALRAAARDGAERLQFAHAVTAAVVTRYWKTLCTAAGCTMPIRLAPSPSMEISAEAFIPYAEACAEIEEIEAFYQIGELYIALLPPDYRARHGIYYTPPTLVKRLLDLFEENGGDWQTARVLDPACGGAAFVAYVAQRMLAANTCLPPEARLRDLKSRLVGIDLDPFSTWLSAVLLDVVCLPLLRDTNSHLDGLIRSGDTLTQNSPELGSFDFVVGNPPYGKVALSVEQRQRFRRSLFGHANLYGVFTDLAVSVTAPGGMIGFVTPTSFLGGEYFKNLRRLLLSETSPLHLSFVSDREGIFSDVLQETALALYRRTSSKRPSKSKRIRVEALVPDSRGSVRQATLGDVVLERSDGGPWILPRSASQVRLVRQLNRMSSRLADYGYRVATGQLVWNRHKTQFRDQSGLDRYPVLWAECIQSDGRFEFRAEKRNHRPFLELKKAQDFLVNQEPCVVVQRTTSKEQSRRLIAAVVPNWFVVEHPGYIVENHLNMLVPTDARPAVPLRVISQLLNSSIVDEAFRCISGSVAVSAYELENLPLPDPANLMRLIRNLPSSPAKVESAIRSFYHEK